MGCHLQRGVELQPSTRQSRCQRVRGRQPQQRVLLLRQQGPRTLLLLLLLLLQALQLRLKKTLSPSQSDHRWISSRPSSAIARTRGTRRMKVKVKVKVTVKVTVKVKAAGPRVGSLAQRRVSGGRSLLIAVVVQAAAR